MNEEQLPISEQTESFKLPQDVKKSYKNLIFGLVLLLVACGIIVGIVYGVSIAKEAL